MAAGVMLEYCSMFEPTELGLVKEIHIHLNFQPGPKLAAASSSRHIIEK